jgi:hypothetical protein
MPRQRHYSPQLTRFLVSVLYHEAKRRQIPMTQLADDLLTQSLMGSEGWKTATELRIAEEPTQYRASLR